MACCSIILARLDSVFADIFDRLVLDIGEGRPVHDANLVGRHPEHGGEIECLMLSDLDELVLLVVGSPPLLALRTAVQKSATAGAGWACFGRRKRSNLVLGRFQCLSVWLEEQCRRPHAVAFQRARAFLCYYMTNECVMGDRDRNAVDLEGPAWMELIRWRVGFAAACMARSPR
jgi:hypothetical protein